MPNSTAIFACADIEKTLAYYKDVLGFTSTWTWGEPPSFGGASREGVNIMFNLQPDLAARIRDTNIGSSWTTRTGGTALI